MWVYCSAQVFFFGAEVTRISANEYGAGIIAHHPLHRYPVIGVPASFLERLDRFLNDLQQVHGLRAEAQPILFHRASKSGQSRPAHS